jgi:hypothetical protein
MVSNKRPDQAVDFLLFPSELLTQAGIRVVQIPMADQHEFLSSRHYGTVGPQHEPDGAFIKRLLSLLPGHSVQVVRMRKSEVIDIARSLLEEFTDLDSYLGEHWREELLGE